MKKITLTKALIAVLLPVIYWLIMTGFNEPAAGNNQALRYYPSPNNGKNFKNIIYNWNPTINPSTWILNPVQLSRYKGELHFTGTHSYDYIVGEDSDGTDEYGIFNQPLSSDQVTHIANLTSQVMGPPQSMDFYFERCKLTKLCYAQRVVYEVTPPLGNNQVNDGFCYSETAGEYTTDQGRTVLHASDPEQQYPNGYMLADKIYENLQHSEGNGKNFGPQHGDAGTWYIKPMMRIDSSIVDNYPERDVVRIDVFNFRNYGIGGPGTAMKTITIKAKNFGELINGQYFYNGSYIDKFYNFDPGTDLEVTGGDWSVHNPPQLNDGRPDRPSIVVASSEGKIDFKVYWCGQVEVWFDKMTVDDEMANGLFNYVHDYTIQNELDSTSRFGFTYFVDEVTWSQVPCIKYVMDKITQYNTEHNTDIRLTCCQNNMQVTAGVRDISRFYKKFISEIQPKEFSLDRVDVLRYFLPEGIFTNVNPKVPGRWFVSKEEYNQYIQNCVFGDKNTFTPVDSYLQLDYEHQKKVPPPWGGNVYDIEHARGQISQYSSQTKLIVQNQLQGFVGIDAGGHYEDWTREPTNEEIEAQVGVALAHGAESFFWFIYQSLEWIRQPSNLPLDVLGLLEINSPNRRLTNDYGQPKWNFISNLNSKILSWKPVLDNITWAGGYSVHSEGADHEYIDNIQSTYQVAPPNGPVFSDQTKYWEIGFFTTAGENTKYFMMVNRRCIPGEDWRWLGIKFDVNAIGSYRNWQITDIATGQVTTFDKYNQGSEGFVRPPEPMKTFQPGEGKIFKLEPVVKSGGILLADEVIPSIAEFTCEDTVWTNGYNLTIQNGAKVHFSDSAKFVVEGGTFTMGNPNQSGQDITMDAAPNGSWKGFEFNGANVGIYNTAFSGLANDSISMLTFIDCPLISLKSNVFNKVQALIKDV